MPQRVSKDNFQSEVLSADTLVLADFYSDSCIPCKRLSPVLFELEKEYEGKLKIAKINVNFDSELASEYEVQAAPTLVFFKNGEEKERLRGAVKKSGVIVMTITVAGNKKEVADNLTVAQLIIDENVETPEYVTVTINDEFVKSGTFEETTLKDGDVVEFLYFMGGGQ